jgi:glucose-1-phosphate adenylyltransferase
MAKTSAVILAGGQGKRMGILCHHRPKPLLPFAGCHRMIDFALSNCLHSGIGDVSILTDFQRFQIAQYVAEWKDENLGRSIKVLEAESHYRGTADAVYQKLDELHESGARNLVVLAADHVYKMDYGPMIDYHESTGADATIGVICMPREEARRFGTVSMDKSNRIIDFAEKCDAPESDTVSMGIYVFSLDSLSRALTSDAHDPLSAHDFGYSILPPMVRVNKVMGFHFDGFWRDIGTVEAYHKANLEIAKRSGDFSLEGGQPVLGARCSLPNPRLSAGAMVHRSIIGKGSVVKGFVENSVIGRGVCIEEHTVVRNSVVMDNVFVGERSVLQSCILDEGVSIDACCEIGAKDRLQFRSGVAVISRAERNVPARVADGDGLLSSEALLTS